MRHAREDYNRIQDPAGKIPDDEPVFLFRAQDRFAWIFVKGYASLMYALGKLDIYELSKMQAKRMREWPVQKDPDL
jgi:hypothetical protein